MQSLVEPFTSESGGRVLQEFAFDQNKTKVAQVCDALAWSGNITLCALLADGKHVR